MVEKKPETQGQMIARELGVNLDVAGRLLQLSSKESVHWRQLAAQAVEEFLQRNGA